MTAPPVRVLIVDDHPLVRSGLAAALAPDAGVEVAGEAGTGAEALAAATRLRPDVVVMDLHMPGMNGIEATREITSAMPATAVLVLTMYEDDASVFAAMRAGARGYLLKGAEQEEILRAIRAVAHGEAIFGASVARRVIEHFGAGTRPPLFPDLTDREREVLELVGRGLDNARIASHLSVSTKTVANNVSNILSKLHITSRAEAIVRARDAGLGRER